MTSFLDKVKVETCKRIRKAALPKRGIGFVRERTRYIPGFVLTANRRFLTPTDVPSR